MNPEDLNPPSLSAGSYPSSPTFELSGMLLPNGTPSIVDMHPSSLSWWALGLLIVSSTAQNNCGKLRDLGVGVVEDFIRDPTREIFII